MKICIRSVFKTFIRILPILTLVVVQIAYARQSNTILETASLDGFLEEQMDRHRIPGMAVAVVQGEEIVYLHAIGTAGSDRSLTTDTPLYIGSVSKSFTALAAMQLVEAGKLDLDAPVQMYLPWFAVGDEQASKTITVRHLLNQTSGFGRADQPKAALPENASIEDAVRSLKSAKPSQPPGSVYQYFNSNYTILGLLIETVSGQSYGSYMRENIFSPLQMENTHTSPEEAQQAGLAQGYSQLFGYPVQRDQPYLAYDLPAGFIMSTAEDMAHYLAAQLNGGRWGQVQVLSQAGVEMMHSPLTETGSPYGMGWFSETVDEIPIVAHSGSLETFYARAVLLPEQGYGLVVLINQNGLLNNTAFEAMTDDITRLLLGTETQKGVPLGLIYLVLTGVMLLYFIGHMITFAQLPRWRERVRDKPSGKVLPGVLVQIALPLVTLIGLPIALMNMLGNTAAWVLVFYYLPEVAMWIALGALLTLLRGLIKAWMLRKDARETDSLINRRLSNLGKL